MRRWRFCKKPRCRFYRRHRYPGDFYLGSIPLVTTMPNHHLVALKETKKLTFSIIIGSNNDQVVAFEWRVLKLFVTLRPAKCALGCFRIGFQTKQLFPSTFKGGIKKNMETFNGICHQASDPTPLNVTNFCPFFTPLFFFCDWISLIGKGFYTWSQSKNITFKSSYNWFKIHIHQQLRPLTANYLAMFKVISTTIYT